MPLIGGLLQVFVFSWDLILCLGVLRSNQLTVQEIFLGDLSCCLSYKFLVLLPILYGVIIYLLLLSPTIPSFMLGLKNIEVDYHFIWEKVVARLIQLQHIGTATQISDIFTKPLYVARFHFLNSKLLIGASPPSLI